MDSQYRQYFEDMPCFLTVQDRDFRIIDANKLFRKNFGDFEGRYCYQVYKRRSERCEICPVARTFRDGERHEEQRHRNTLIPDRSEIDKLAASGASDEEVLKAAREYEMKNLKATAVGARHSLIIPRSFRDGSQMFNVTRDGTSAAALYGDQVD